VSIIHSYIFFFYYKFVHLSQYTHIFIYSDYLINLTKKKKIQNDHNIKTYQIFMGKIRKCSKIIKKPNLKNDICMNGINCLKIQIVPLRSGNVNIMKNIACPCSTHYKFKYECSKMYCTLDKYSLIKTVHHSIFN